MIACDKHHHFSQGPTCELCDRGDPAFSADDAVARNRAALESIEEVRASGAFEEPVVRLGEPEPEPTSSRLKEIRLRHAEATPGPWKPDPMKSFVWSARGEMIASESNKRDQREHGIAEDSVVLRGIGAGLNLDANHDFIVNSWGDIGFLLAEIRRLHEEVVVTRQERDARPEISVALAVRWCSHETDRGAYREVSDAVIEHADKSNSSPARLYLDMPKTRPFG